MKANRNSSYFVVEVPKVDLDENTLIDDLVEKFSEYTSIHPPRSDAADPRGLCPWLRAVRWHDLVSGKTVEECRKLVALPEGDEYPTLLDSVVGFIKNATSLIDQTSELTLQQINTEDRDRKEGRSINHTPFKVPMHFEDGASKSYANPIAGLLAMLLRGSPVPLQPNMDEALEVLRSCLAAKDIDKSAEACYRLLCLIWTFPWKPVVQRRVTDPTVIYLAYSSLLPDGSFKDTHLLTNVFARCKYSVRCVVLIRIKTEHEDEKEGWMANERWLREDNECTFRSLCSAQHIATTLTLSTMSLPEVWWTDVEKYQSMLYRGVPLHLSEIVEVVRSLEQTVQHQFEELVLFGTDKRADYGLLVDDMALKEVGYSFSTDKRNSIFFDHQNSLLRSALGNEAFRQKMVTHLAPGVLRFNHLALRTWLVEYAKFHDLLLTYIHITSGAPARGTEMTAMLLVNTPLYPRRNLYRCADFMVLMVTYLKTSALTQKDKLIPHALGSFAADLLVQDLAMARPFARLAARLVHSESPQIYTLFDTHVFINHTKLFETEDISARLTSLSSQSMKVKLNTSTWRHIFSSFRRKLCPRMEALEELEEENRENTVEADQAGHNRQTEDRVYGISHHSMEGAAEDVLPLYCSASTQWQEVVRVVPGGMRGSYKRFVMANFDILVKPERNKNEASSHSTIIRLEAKLDLVLKALNTSLNPAPIAAAAPLSEPTQRDALHYAFPSPLDALRHLLKNRDAQWRSIDQEKAVATALEGRKDLIAVLRTGFGKTMIAFVPAVMEINRTTVLILPLRVLIADFGRKLLKMGIDFEVFSASQQRLAGKSQIVIVSADTVNYGSFVHAISILNLTRPVSRYVIDEAHIPLLSEDYRPALADLYKIRMTIPCQLVLLSATVPHSMEGKMKEKYILSDNTVVLRASSNRPEL
ncbi:hypothetical protein CPB83DRAFT_778069, partial [Crepidotus variabilis]